MNFSNVERITLELVMFSNNEWLKANAGNVLLMNFGDRIVFLENSWKVDPMGHQDLFLYQTIYDKSYRIRLHSSREVHGGNVKSISGEIRVEIDNGVFEVQAILKIGGITERGPNTSDPSWVIRKTKEDTENEEKKNFLKWTTDEVYHWVTNELNINKSEAQYLRDEDVDGFVLSKLNQEMNGLNIKYGTKVKLWSGINTLLNKD
jgi:hypothetical protein